MRIRLLPLLALIGALAAAGGCGPRARPKGPGTTPTHTKPGARKPAPRAPASTREVLVGEMCPQAAAGRPAVAPVLAHRIDWVDEPGDLAEEIEKRWARQFSVFGWDGRRVGVFSVAGAAKADSRPAVAIGSYAGSSPCQPPARTDGEVSFDPVCVEAQAHCGLAVAELEPSGGYRARPFSEDPKPAEFEQGGACASAGRLVVDLDRDGHAEVFAAERFLDSFRAPAEEVVAEDDPPETDCEPAFTVRNLVPPGDPRDWRGLDVLGVIDLDGDGRLEVVAVYHYGNRRTWAIYSPRSSSARLELVGEGLPWQTR